MGLALSGVIDVRQAMHALLARIVPALAGTATVAMLGDAGVVEHAVTRSTLLDDVCTSQDIAAARLPTAHYELLHAALALAPAERPRRAPYADGALRMLPLVDGDRMRGALWVDGELTAAGAALLDDIALRAASAFATLALHRDLQREIEERRQAEARLDESHRRKDEFLAMLAHELRNPLAPIRNAVEVIRRVAPPEPTLRWAADVTDRQLRHLTRLVDDLVDVARINEGKIVLQMQCVDLVALAAQCIENQRPELEARGQTMSLAMPGSAVHLNGDPTRLAQVVDNLLKNASTYTPEGGAIAVSLVRESADDGEFVALTVADDGIGIEPELLRRVFDLFEQGQRALDRAPGGLGVGLTLVQRLVGLHGGSVWAERSGTGQGSHFRVRLPCMAERDDVLPVDDAAAAPTPIVARRILVVEDNLDVAETTTLLLTLSGHEVLCAKDGLQALQFAADFQPEVVLLDIGLPLMDGYEVARRLRQMPQTRRPLVVALTGYGQEGDRQRGKEAGFDGHLLKPVDARALEAMLAR